VPAGGFGARSRRVVVARARRVPRRRARDARAPRPLPVTRRELHRRRASPGGRAHGCRPGDGAVRERPQRPTRRQRRRDAPDRRGGLGVADGPRRRRRPRPPGACGARAGCGGVRRAVPRPGRRSKRPRHRRLHADVGRGLSRDADVAGGRRRGDGGERRDRRRLPRPLPGSRGDDAPSCDQWLHDARDRGRATGRSHRSRAGRDRRPVRPRRRRPARRSAREAVRGPGAAGGRRDVYAGVRRPRRGALGGRRHGRRAGDADRWEREAAVRGHRGRERRGARAGDDGCARPDGRRRVCDDRGRGPPAPDAGGDRRPRGGVRPTARRRRARGRRRAGRVQGRVRVVRVGEPGRARTDAVRRRRVAGATVGERARGAVRVREHRRVRR